MIPYQGYMENDFFFGKTHFLKTIPNYFGKTCVEKKSLNWVNAWYRGSKVAKNTLIINPYKIFLNDSNGHGYYLKNINVIIFE
jgi:hypothetical protein